MLFQSLVTLISGLTDYRATEGFAVESGDPTSWWGALGMECRGACQGENQFPSWCWPVWQEAPAAGTQTRSSHMRWPSLQSHEGQREVVNYWAGIQLWPQICPELSEDIVCVLFFLFAEVAETWEVQMSEINHRSLCVSCDSLCPLWRIQSARGQSEPHNHEQHWHNAKIWRHVCMFYNCSPVNDL